MISFFHDDLISLYKLIERLLYLSDNEETQIIAGKLPKTFPDIPLPPGATIVGSVIERDEWHDRTKVFFDIGLTPQQLNNFYHDNLVTKWQEKEDRGTAFRRFDYSLQKTSNNMGFINTALNIELDIEITESQHF